MPDNTYIIKTESEELLATSSAFMEEDSIMHGGIIYRPWNPSTSKLASMLLKGMKVPIKSDSKVLYLGAASGTTVSHVADIASDGIVFAAEFAPRPTRDLLQAVRDRINVVPMLADARYPESYPPFIDSVDIIYQDIAQPNQSEIMVSNATKYLRPGGIGVMAIKAKSISISEDVKSILEREVSLLEESFEILEKVSLEPLHHDHLAVMGKFKG
ncbi:fibrillin [Methanocella sp. CWC-04]|uniref:Fibrillarin-like rRNA/tRNA 2'-O-methyltransferase n=2 Tax=Methanooceanicella nereidis TaxID=2052831 RepID=A0AAP2W521_9EURY|nr:fibrillin [Methanocella sp. CWC-04]